MADFNAWLQQLVDGGFITALDKTKVQARFAGFGPLAVVTTKELQEVLSDDGYQLKLAAAANLVGGVKDAERAAAQAAAAPAAVATPAVDPMVKFRELLGQRGISNPREENLRAALIRYTTLFLLAVERENLQLAEDVYEMTRDVLKSSTRLHSLDAGLSVNGLWRPDIPYICTAVYQGNLHVVKLLPRSDSGRKAACAAELQAVELLGLGGDNSPANLVPCRAIDIRVPNEAASAVELAASEHPALLMPWYRATVKELPLLPKAHLVRGGRCIQSALITMHKKKLVHTDVKATNVFVDRDAGEWVLGDFGSAVLVDTAAFGVTTGFYPDIDIRGLPAKPEFDWGLLLVMILAERRKDMKNPLDALSKANRVQKDMVLREIEAEDDPELRKFLDELKELAWPAATI